MNQESKNFEYKYVVGHTIKVPTEQYGNEEFYYSVKGDNMPEVLKDLIELKKNYPPVTIKEKAKRLAAGEETTTGF